MIRSFPARLSPARALRISAVVFCVSCPWLNVVRAEVHWICTTADAPWRAMPAPEMVHDASAVPDVTAHPDKPGQSIDGFGGCFNELGWKALSALPEAKREEVIRALFGDDGCGFTLARTPIGASDFALDAYSLNDTPGDLEMKRFTIDRDLKCNIAYIKAAMQVRPDLKVWASAWSPPAWMKDNNHYSGGHLKTDPPTLRAYALYLARFVEEYQSAGVPIYAVAVQNEPRIVNNYPTCLWDGRQIRDFVRDEMGPTWRQRHVKAELWLGTVNDRSFNGVVERVMGDEEAAKSIDAIAFQWDGQHIIADTHRLYPNMKLVQSENECHDGNNSFADAEHTFALFRRYMEGGASSYFFWNMVLQADGKSSWGWKQNAMISVDPQRGAVTYHPEFYFMKHVAHFVRPGAQLCPTTGEWGDRIAFRRADGATIYLIGNSAKTELPIVIGVPGRTDRVIRVRLPSHSFNTFVVPAD